MNLKDILNNYKKGSSIDKLGIISNLITIFTAVVAIITSQIFAMKFVFDESTLIRTIFYLFAFGLTLLVLHVSFKVTKLFLSEKFDFLFKISLIILFNTCMLFITYIIWSFMLTFE